MENKNGLSLERNMPVYEFKCEKCGGVTELFAKRPENKYTENCSFCSGKAYRIVSKVSKPILKGLDSTKPNIKNKILIFFKGLNNLVPFLFFENIFLIYKKTNRFLMVNFYRFDDFVLIREALTEVEKITKDTIHNPEVEPDKDSSIYPDKKDGKKKDSDDFKPDEIYANSSVPKMEQLKALAIEMYKFQKKIYDFQDKMEDLIDKMKAKDPDNPKIDDITLRYDEQIEKAEERLDNLEAQMVAVAADNSILAYAAEEMALKAKNLAIKKGFDKFDSDTLNKWLKAAEEMKAKPKEE